MFNRSAYTCVWFTMVVLAQNATLPTVQAEVTFFTNRAAWEAEANNRGLPFAEENFDGFPVGPLWEIPSFTVGDIQFGEVVDSIGCTRLVDGARDAGNHLVEGTTVEFFCLATARE